MGFIGLLFQVQGLEDFSELAVEGVTIVPCQIFDELLGDGGAAEVSVAC